MFSRDAGQNAWFASEEAWIDVCASSGDDVGHGMRLEIKSTVIDQSDLLGLEKIAGNNAIHQMEVTFAL